MKVVLSSNAKINPTLRVLGRRADGYHELVTSLLSLELAGTVCVEVEAGGGPTGIRFTTDGAFASPDVPVDGSNLAVRGAELVTTGRAGLGQVALHAEKGVPSRAGLGGGSAEAAAAALGVHLATGGDDEGSQSLTAELAGLGVDCAFFHGARHTGAALATGRGDEIEVVEARPDWSVLIVTPAAECSTPAIYGALGLEPGRVQAVDLDVERRSVRELLSADAESARALLVNDLEAAARRAVPEVDAWFAMAAELGLGHMRLAGSGSSLFGIFVDDGEAEDARARLLGEAGARGLGVRASLVTRPAGHALQPVPDRAADAGVTP